MKLAILFNFLPEFLSGFSVQNGTGNEGVHRHENHQEFVAIILSEEKMK